MKEYQAKVAISGSHEIITFTAKNQEEAKKVFQNLVEREKVLGYSEVSCNGEVIYFIHKLC